MSLNTPSNLQITDIDTALAAVRGRLSPEQEDAVREAYRRNFGEHNDSVTRGGLAGTCLTTLDGSIKWLQEFVRLILSGTKFDEALKEANEISSKFASVRTAGRAAVMFNVQCREAGVDAETANTLSGCAPVRNGEIRLDQNSDSVYDQVIDGRGLRGFDDGNNMSLDLNPAYNPGRARVLPRGI